MGQYDEKAREVYVERIKLHKFACPSTLWGKTALNINSLSLLYKSQLGIYICKDIKTKKKKQQIRKFDGNRILYIRGFYLKKKKF